MRYTIQRNIYKPEIWHWYPQRPQLKEVACSIHFQTTTFSHLSKFFSLLLGWRFSKKSTPTNPPNMSGKNPTPTSLDQTNEAKQKHPVKKEILPLWFHPTDPRIFPEIPKFHPTQPHSSRAVFWFSQVSGRLGLGGPAASSGNSRASSELWNVDGSSRLMVLELSSMGHFTSLSPEVFNGFSTQPKKNGRSSSCKKKWYISLWY